MQRLCFVFDLVPGMESRYDDAHADIWPELAAAILDAGYRNYSLFRRASHVICTCECWPDIETVRRQMHERHQELTDRWNVLMEPLIQRMTDDDGMLTEYTLCWHLDEAAR